LVVSPLVPIIVTVALSNETNLIFKVTSDPGVLYPFTVVPELPNQLLFLFI